MSMMPEEALGFLAANPCECGQECDRKKDAIAVLRRALKPKVLARGWLAGINRTYPDGPIQQAMFSCAEPKWAGQKPVVVYEEEP